MKPLHIGVAVLVAVIWGVAFVVSKIGLQSFTPPQLTALRFVIAAIPVLWLPRPRIPVGILIGIGLTIFTGQFLLQFFGIAKGTPAGLTAVLVQTQALFTVLFAAIAMGDRPRGQQIIGMAVAALGIALICLTIGNGVTLIGFVLTLSSAVSWAVGNILVKRSPKVSMLELMAWASLVPPLPAYLISAILDGPEALFVAITHASLPGLAAPLFLGIFASVIAYAIWGNLLQRYAAAEVAPFALLAPVVGALTSMLVFGEHFGALRLTGMAGILLGVALTALPWQRFRVLSSASASPR